MLSVQCCVVVVCVCGGVFLLVFGGVFLFVAVVWGFFGCVFKIYLTQTRNAALQMSSHCFVPDKKHKAALYVL